MPDISDSIGEIGGTIRAMLGLTTRNRLRDQIRDTVALYESTAKHDALAGASADLAQVISQETKRLLDTSNSTGRDWNFSAWLVCWVISSGCAIGVYALRIHWPTWWAVLLIVGIGLAGFLFFIAGFAMLFQKSGEKV
jgi:CHASE2 domain-containing sensor protein